MPWNSQYPPLPLPTCPCLFISTADAHAWPMRSHTSVTHHSTSLWAIHCCRVIDGEGWAWSVEIACFDDHFGIAVCPNNLDIYCLRPLPLHNGLQCAHPKRRSNRTEFITCGSPWRCAQTSRPIGLSACVSLSLLVCVASLGVKISWNQYQYARKALYEYNTEGIAYMFCWIDWNLLCLLSLVLCLDYRHVSFIECMHVMLGRLNIQSSKLSTPCHMKVKLLDRHPTTTAWASLNSLYASVRWILIPTFILKFSITPSLVNFWRKVKVIK